MQAPGRDTRVVELRVHGILGTTGNALTDSVASVDVAGDGVGRIVRPADRLRRPVEGPNLPTGDGSVPRVVEGYVWGGMTSGGLAKASWALLFPFALANVAHWMLPPVRPGDRVGGLISGVLRAVMRLSALLLTMLFVAQLTVIGLDLVAAQCLSPGAQCMTFVPDAVRHLDAVRSAITLLPVGLAVLLMYRISGVSWRVSAGAREAAQESGRAPMLPGANVVADPDTPALRAMHITAALSTVALLVMGGPFSPSLDPRWLGAAALLLIALVGAVAIDDPAGLYSAEDARRGRVALGRPQRRTLMTIAALVFTSVGLMPGALDHPLEGSGSTIGLI